MKCTIIILFASFFRIIAYIYVYLKSSKIGSELEDTAELSQLSNEVEELEKLAAKMKSALVGGGGQKTKDSKKKTRRPKRGKKQADKLRKLKGSASGGGGAVTLCQLMNICDSVALGKFQAQ